MTRGLISRDGRAGGAWPSSRAARSRAKVTLARRRSTGARPWDATTAPPARRIPVGSGLSPRGYWEFNREATEAAKYLDERQHGVAPFAAHDCRAPTGRLVGSGLARSLDRSEKVARCYALRQTMTGVFRQQVVSVRLLNRRPGIRVLVRLQRHGCQLARPRCRVRAAVCGHAATTRGVR